MSRRLLAWLGRSWLLPLFILVALLVAAHLFGDHPPTAAILHVLL
jgi:hypothetical protein